MTRRIAEVARRVRGERLCGSSSVNKRIAPFHHNPKLKALRLAVMPPRATGLAILRVLAVPSADSASISYRVNLLPLRPA